MRPDETCSAAFAARTFLRRHWQKRPLLVRGALPGFAGVLEKRALLALARRDDVESRIVKRRGARWETEHGPFGGEITLRRQLDAAGERRKPAPGGGRRAAAALRLRAAGAARRPDGELRHARRRRRAARRFLRRVPAAGTRTAAMAGLAFEGKKMLEYVLGAGRPALPAARPEARRRRARRPASPTRSASARRAARSSAPPSSTGCTSAACRMPATAIPACGRAPRPARACRQD